LPFVDEHATHIDAGVGDVWSALIHTLDRALSRAEWVAYARIVGCADYTASGPRPLAVGSTIPGFRVDVVVPGSELVLEGSHRFSSYALTFRLDKVSAGRSQLSAETRAAFPGFAGGVYRLLVIGTRGHVFAVERLLATVKRRSEQGGSVVDDPFPLLFSP
jgi:hypothetical protein